MQLTAATLVISPGGSERQFIQQLGLAVSAEFALPELGLAGCSYCFDTTRLDLVWLESEQSRHSQLLTSVDWWARMTWPATGACPFWVSELAEQTDDGWHAAPAGFEPLGVVGFSAESASRPLSLRANSAAPAAIPAGASQRELGLGDITQIAIAGPGGGPERADGLALVAAAGEEHHMIVTLDGGRRGQSINLAPMIPLEIRV